MVDTSRAHSAAGPSRVEQFSKKDAQKWDSLFPHHAGPPAQIDWPRHLCEQGKQRPEVGLGQNESVAGRDMRRGIIEGSTKDLPSSSLDHGPATNAARS